MANSAVVKIGWSDNDVRAGVSRTRGMLTQLSADVKTAFTGIGGLARGALGFAGVGLGIAGIRGLFDEFDRIGDLSQQLNESPEVIQRIGFAAQLAGSDTETIVRAMNKLNREVANGGAAEAFAELGISSSEFLKLDADKQIVELATAFQRAEASGKGLTAAYDLFGRAASELLPLLRSSNEELREMSEREVISEAEIARIQYAGDQMDKMIKSFGNGLVETGFTASKFFQSFGASMADLWKGGDGTAFIQKWSELEKKEADFHAEQDEKRARRKEALSKLSIDGLKKQLGAEKEGTAQASAASEGHWNTVDKLVKAREKMVALGRKLGDASNAPEEERLRIEIEYEKAKQAVLGLEKQFQTEVKASEKAEAEKAEQMAKIANEQRDALALYQIETGIIDEHARGHEKKAKQMERALKIAQDTARLQKEAGLTKDQAAKLANDRADAADKADKKDGKIHGYSQTQRATNKYNNPHRGLDELERLNKINPDGSRNPAWMDKTRRQGMRIDGLDNFDRMQEGKPGQRTNPAFVKQPPAGNTAPSNATVEKLLQELVSETQVQTENLKSY